MEKDLTSKALKLIFSRLRMKLENFFCFTSNFKLEQKVTLNQKVFSREGNSITTKPWSDFSISLL